MKKVKAQKINSTDTPKELRDILMTDLRDFRKGNITCKEASTVARMSDAVMRTLCR